MYPSPLLSYRLNAQLLPPPATAVVDSRDNTGFTVGSHLVLTWLGLDAGTANLLSQFHEPTSVQFQHQDAHGNWSPVVTAFAYTIGARTYGALWPSTLASGALGAQVAVPSIRARRLTLVLTFPIAHALAAAYFPAQV